MFKKAIKSQSKLRCAIYGVAGSGKTYSSLRIAAGMGEKIAVIDTERGSASLYSDKYNFDVCELADKTIDSYIKAINYASGKYDVIIIDSLSHAWQELLEEVEKIAKAKYRGNTWSAWSEGTPKQKALIDAINSCDAHVISTMRAKTEWIVEKDQNNKTRIERAGLAPEQRGGMEYEFSLILQINADHFATVIKDRTGMFQDKILDKPGEDFGKTLIEWLNVGEKMRDKLSDDEQSVIADLCAKAEEISDVKDLRTLYKDAQDFLSTISGLDKKAVAESLDRVVAVCNQRKRLIGG